MVWGGAKAPLLFSPFHSLTTTCGGALLSWTYVIRRLIYLVLNLWVLITIAFFLFRLLPGNPADFLIDPLLTDPQRRAEVMERLGLNDPLFIQYFKYLGALLVGDLGHSFRSNLPVTEIVGRSFANTMVLVVAMFVVAYTVGVTVGAWFASRRGALAERVGGTLALFVRGMPGFFLGVLLVMIFAVTLGWLPSTGMRSGNYQEQSLFAIYTSWDFIRHLILPVATAAITACVAPMILMRNTMLDVMHSDFMELVEAKGVSRRKRLYRHGVRNALMPLIAEGSQFIGYAVGGLVEIEVVFSWPGLGREIVTAINTRDYVVAQGAFIYIGVLVMIVYFIADILAALLDPRLRRASAH